jgi:hypothetical protein
MSIGRSEWAIARELTPCGTYTRSLHSGIHLDTAWPLVSIDLSCRPVNLYPVKHPTHLNRDACGGLKFEIGLT